MQNIETISPTKTSRLWMTRYIHKPSPDTDIDIAFCASHSWPRSFCWNVYVDAPSGNRDASVSLAINQDHPRFSNAMQKSKKIETVAGALDIVSKMEWAVMHHDQIPEHVHSAVIGNMGALALAHVLHKGGIFNNPRIMNKLYPVMVAYDQVTQQQHPDIHHDILTRASA